MNILKTTNLELNQKSMTPEEQILNLIQEINPIKPMQYVNELIKPYAIEKLNDEITYCRKCEIGKMSKKRSYVCGNVASPILIISDYIRLDKSNENSSNSYVPLGDENSFNIFLEALKAIGEHNVNDYLYCNCVNCHTCDYNNKKERLPNKKEINMCYETILHEAIEIVKPKLLLILGNTALRSFSDCNFSEVRGQAVDILSIPSIVTYAPYYFIKMKNIKDEEALNKEYKLFLDDLRLAFNYLKEIA